MSTIDIPTLKRGVMGFLEHMKKEGIHDGRLDSAALFVLYRLFKTTSDEKTLELLLRFAARDQADVPQHHSGISTAPSSGSP